MRIVVLAAVLLALLALGWWGLRQGDGEQPGVPGVLGAGATALQPVEALEAPVAQRTDAATSATDREPLPASSLQGTLVLPTGSPADPALEIVARFSLQPSGAERVVSKPSNDGTFRIAVPRSARRCILGIRSKSYWLPGEHVLDPAHGFVFDADSPQFPRIELCLAAYGRLDVEIARGPGVEVPSDQIAVILQFEESPRFLPMEEKRTTEPVGDRFTFDDLRPDETVSLSVAAPGCFGEEQSGLRVPASGPLHVVLELVASASIEGRVLTSDGEPIPRASVRAFASGPRPYDGWNGDNTLTDGAGWFRLTPVRPGRTVLETQISLGGGATGEVRRPLLLDEEFEGVRTGSWFSWTDEIGEVLAGTTIHVELAAPEVRDVACRVIWPDGRPATGARFRARLPHVGGSPRHAGYEWGTLGESARFHVAVAERDSTEIFLGIESGDPGPWFAHWNKRPEDPLPHEELVLILAPPREVSARIVDDRGELCTEAFLEWTPHGRSGLSLDGKRSALAGGELQVPVPAGCGVWLRTIDKGSSLTLAELDWNDGDAEPIVLVSPRSCGLSGEVSGARELFLSKVRVRSRWPAHGGNAQRETDVHIDEQDRFTFENLPPGKTFVWIEGRRSDAVQLDLAPGERRAGVVLLP